MFWLYLIIFAVITFVPYIIDSPHSKLTEDQTESLVIFFLALGALFLYVASENKFLKQWREKVSAQRQHTSATKDLSESYSYIGIVNRKLELLKDIMVNIPTKELLTEEKEKKIYDSVCEALKVVCGDDQFVIRFVNMTSHSTVREIKGDSSYHPQVKNKQLCSAIEKEIIDLDDECIAVASPRDIDNVRVYVIIHKSSHIKDDPDYIKTIASQALLIYTLAQNHEKESGDLPKSR